MSKRKILSTSNDSAVAAIKPLLSEPDSSAEVKPEKPKRVFPAQFSFKGPWKGRKQRPVAADSSNGAKETIPRPAREQSINIVGPKTKIAVAEGVIEADFPDGILAPSRSRRAKIMQWAQFRATEPGITNVEIASRLGVSAAALNGYITIARREGWLRFEDPIARMEFEIVPKVMDNLNKLLDREDRTTTIETAKGTIFRTYQDSKGISDAPQAILALRIEQAEGTNTKFITGHIVGRSKAIKEMETP